MRSALLDTNLFLLLIVGLYDKKLIEKHKRTKAFTPEDFDLLVELITVDLDLYLEISNQGNKVINFNHLRTTGLLQP